MPTTAYTADQRALEKHIEDLNAKAVEWMAESKGRWSSMFETDPRHWESYAVYSVADFERYQTMNLAYELHKDRCGFKPNWAELTTMSLKELDDMIERLASVQVDEPIETYIW